MSGWVDDDDGANSAVKAGFLMKGDTRSRFVAKAADQRWFVLRPRQLAWFKSKDDPQPSNCIDVALYRAEVSEHSLFRFLLVPRDANTPNARGRVGKGYVLDATNMAERDAWVEEFNKLSDSFANAVPRPSESSGGMGAGSKGEGGVVMAEPPKPDRPNLVTHVHQNLFHVAGTKGGTAVMWGGNDHGQLGNSRAGVFALPVKVREFESVHTVVDVVCGDTFTVLLSQKDEGCTGVFLFGLVGKPPTVVPATRIIALDDTPISMLAAGSNHALALADTGAVFGWGNNMFGQLGQGNTRTHYVSHTQPVVVGKGVLPACRTIDAGGNSCAAISMAGQLYVWGANGFGQCGDVALRSVLAPTLLVVPGETSVLSVACGLVHMTAVANSHQVYAWGCALDGRLGHDELSVAPRNAPLPSTKKKSKIRLLAKGKGKDDEDEGEPHVFGGDLGDSEKAVVPEFPQCKCSPAVIPKLTGKGVEKVFAGDCHTVALTRQGKLYTWGLGENGQLGRDEDISPHPVSLKGEGYPRFLHVACGSDFTVGITESLRVVAWGRGRDGVLGQGVDNVDDSNLPVPVQQLEGIKAAKVACGVNFCAALVIGDTDSVPRFESSAFEPKGKPDKQTKQRIKELKTENSKLRKVNEQLREDKKRQNEEMDRLKAELQLLRQENAALALQAGGGRQAHAPSVLEERAEWVGL